MKKADHDTDRSRSFEALPADLQSRRGATRSLFARLFYGCGQFHGWESARFGSFFAVGSSFFSIGLGRES